MGDILQKSEWVVIEFIILENQITQALSDYCQQVWRAFSTERHFIQNDKKQRTQICEMAVQWYCATVYLDYDQYKTHLLSDNDAVEQFYQSTAMIFESYIDLSKDTPMNKSLYVRGMKAWLQQHTPNYFADRCMGLDCYRPCNTDKFNMINDEIYQAVNGQCQALWNTGMMDWRRKVDNHILTCENILKWYCLVEKYNYDDYLNEYTQLNKQFQDFRNGTRIVFDDMIDLGGYKDNCQRIYVLGIIDWLKNFTSEYFYNYDFKQFKVCNKDEI